MTYQILNNRGIRITECDTVKEVMAWRKAAMTPTSPPVFVVLVLPDGNIRHDTKLTEKVNRL